MADPVIVAFDVRCVWMSGRVSIIRMSARGMVVVRRRGAMVGLRTVRGNVSSPDVVPSSLRRAAVLSMSLIMLGKRSSGSQNNRGCQNCYLSRH